MSSLTFPQLKRQLERIDRLDSQVSPETFWQDGEKPNTPANQRQWLRLQQRLEKAQLKAQAMLSQMTPAWRAEVLAKLPDRLRSLAVFLSPAVKQQ